ncbi:MFS transporter [Aquimarina sp. AD10]|uniref:MFS transporter n=1 Tax=Aquimarina sp. AD10 TaxID=1714849 RepID=UPI000E499CDC|nr:MFS transporter [Aquimarina sp. AD10]AXT62041.1 MFS transporter [Aquimarina sp. AD10]RKM99971.1 MFS transporter [Aquimarina sp. AD10]
MERILHQVHGKHTFIYACSRLFERASYYGLRSLLVLYMVGESLKMSTEEALKIYGWFTAGIVFSQIFGALLGDLIIGNRKSIILGGIIQAIGAFSFCIPSTIGLYFGLFLIVLGEGFYTPNMISHFGKLYLNKTKILDSGFTIFYLAVNMGAFIGAILIGYLGEKFSWEIGFATAGMLTLLSVVFPLISKEIDTPKKIEQKNSFNNRIVKVLIAFILVGLFWGVYEISTIRIFDLQMKFGDYSTLNIAKDLLSSLNSIFIIPTSVIAIILWSYFYNNQFIKLTIGFLLGAISFGVLFLIPETPSEKHLILYLISSLFLSLSEIHIAPVIYAILTKYVNPKYLAIVISLAFIPTRFFTFIVGLFNDDLYDNPLLALKIGMIIISLISIGLIIYISINKKATTLYNKL